MTHATKRILGYCVSQCFAWLPGREGQKGPQGIGEGGGEGRGAPTICIPDLAPAYHGINTQRMNGKAQYNSAIAHMTQHENAQTFGIGG